MLVYSLIFYEVSISQNYWKILQQQHVYEQSASGIAKQTAFLTKSKFAGVLTLSGSPDSFLTSVIFLKLFT